MNRNMIITRIDTKILYRIECVSRRNATIRSFWRKKKISLFYCIDQHFIVSIQLCTFKCDLKMKYKIMMIMSEFHLQSFHRTFFPELHFFFFKCTPEIIFFVCKILFVVVIVTDENGPSTAHRRVAFFFSINPEKKTILIASFSVLFYYFKIQKETPGRVRGTRACTPAMFIWHHISCTICNVHGARARVRAD